MYETRDSACWVALLSAWIARYEYVINIYQIYTPDRVAPKFSNSAEDHTKDITTYCITIFGLWVPVHYNYLIYSLPTPQS